MLDPLPGIFSVKKDLVLPERRLGRVKMLTNQRFDKVHKKPFDKPCHQRNLDGQTGKVKEPSAFAGPHGLDEIIQCECRPTSSFDETSYVG